MKSHVVRRDVPLAVHTGSLDLFTHMLPQVTDQRISQTGSPLHGPGNKLQGGKWDRKVVATPQTSLKSLPRFQRKVNDNYCVLNAVGVKDSVHVSSKKQDLNPSPLTSDKQERECICCKCSFCHRVSTKERRKSQLLLQLNRNKTCERLNDISCVGHLSSANTVTNVAINPPVGARTAILGEVGSSRFESTSSHNTERGLHPPLPVQTQPNQVTNDHKQLCQPTKTVLPSGGTVSADKQKCSGTGSKPKLTGFLQPAIFGTQTQQPVETYPGPEQLEHLPKHRVVQNGDPRDNKDLPTARGVGHLHRLQGRILPCTNSQSVQEVYAFSHPGSVLPVQSSTLWSVHSTHGVHSGGQRGQTGV